MKYVTTNYVKNFRNFSILKKSRKIFIESFMIDKVLFMRQERWVYLSCRSFVGFFEWAL